MKSQIITEKKTEKRTLMTSRLNAETQQMKSLPTIPRHKGSAVLFSEVLEDMKQTELIQNLMKNDRKKLPRLKDNWHNTRDISYLKDYRRPLNLSVLKLPTDIDDLSKIKNNSELVNTRQTDRIVTSHLSERIDLDRNVEFSFTEKLERCSLGNPTGRQDIENLTKWVSIMKEKYISGMNGPCDQVVIYSACLNEIIRQVSVHCVERGTLLREVLDSLIELNRLSATKNAERTYKENTVLGETNRKLSEELQKIHAFHRRNAHEFIEKLGDLEKENALLQLEKTKLSKELEILKGKYGVLCYYLNNKDKALQMLMEQFKKHKLEISHNMKKYLLSFQYQLSDTMAPSSYEPHQEFPESEDSLNISFPNQLICETTDKEAQTEITHMKLETKQELTTTQFNPVNIPRTNLKALSIIPVLSIFCAASYLTPKLQTRKSLLKTRSPIRYNRIFVTTRSKTKPPVQSRNNYLSHNYTLRPLTNAATKYRSREIRRSQNRKKTAQITSLFVTNSMNNSQEAMSSTVNSQIWDSPRIPIPMNSFIEDDNNDEIASIRNSSFKCLKKATFKLENEVISPSELSEDSPEIFSSMPVRAEKATIFRSSSNVEDCLDEEEGNTEPAKSTRSPAKTNFIVYKKTTKFLEFDWYRVRSGTIPSKKATNVNSIVHRFLLRSREWIRRKGFMGKRMSDKMISRIYALAITKKSEAIPMTDIVYEEFHKRYSLKSISEKKMLEFLCSLARRGSIKSEMLLSFIGAGIKIQRQNYSTFSLDLYLSAYHFMIKSKAVLSYQINERPDDLMLPLFRAIDCLRELSEKYLDATDYQRLVLWVEKTSIPDSKRNNPSGLISLDHFLREIVTVYENYQRLVYEGISQLFEAASNSRYLTKQEFIVTLRFANTKKPLSKVEELETEDFSLDDVYAACLTMNLLSITALNEALSSPRLSAAYIRDSKGELDRILQEIEDHYDVKWRTLEPEVLADKLEDLLDSVEELKLEVVSLGWSIYTAEIYRIYGQFIG